MEFWLTFLRYCWLAGAILGTVLQFLWVRDSVQDRRASPGLVADWQVRQSILRLVSLIPFTLAALLVAWEPTNIEEEATRRLVAVNLFLVASAAVSVVAPFALYISKERIKRSFR